ncbi:MAG: helix-turn-helix transcriptional regulator [Trueperaceae bacterium]|nr:helix-turn-helix transcriptional regulator [Trueperaceae bacterium]
MNAADTLKTCRASAGSTQRALAAASGVSQPRIAAYESGRVVPTADSLQRLLDACKVRPSLVLERHRDAVLGMVSEAGGLEPRVFGSVARGEDVEWRRGPREGRARHHRSQEAREGREVDSGSWPGRVSERVMARPARDAEPDRTRLRWDQRCHLLGRPPPGRS